MVQDEENEITWLKDKLWNQGKTKRSLIPSYKANSSRIKLEPEFKNKIRVTLLLNYPNPKYDWCLPASNPSVTLKKLFILEKSNTKQSYMDHSGKFLKYVFSKFI